jgi:hypothetical protein
MTAVELAHQVRGMQVAAWLAGGKEDGKWMLAV